MIKNKLITIEKDNRFDKGWALFEKFDLIIPRNREYRAISITEIVRAITYSSSVDIILCEPCLAGSIVEELRWVNKHLGNFEHSIRLIVKNKKLLDRYSSLKFAEVTINADIDFNYIGIIGKESLHVIVSDDYTQVDDAIWQAFFGEKKVIKDFSFLKSATHVIIVDGDGKKNYSEVIEECRKKNIQLIYILPPKQFDKAIFEEIKPPVALCVAEKLKNGIIVVTQDGRLYCVNRMGNGLYFSSEIDNVLYFFGTLYKCLRLPDTVDTSVIPLSAYVCINGKLQPLSIKPKNIIERQVDIADMADFVAEKFDYSVVDKHNDYSAEAEKTEYRFTLVPPLFDSSFRLSAIYDGIRTLYQKWIAQQNFSLLRLKKEIDDIVVQSHLSLLCSELNGKNEWLKTEVERYNFYGFHNGLKSLSTLLEEGQIKLLYYFEQVFLAVNSQTSGEKFSRFDEEITGYRKIISEKQALIDEGTEVKSNKHRIELLERKISGLLELKKSFEKSAASRDERFLTQFIEKCNKILSGTVFPEARSEESIGNVLQTSESGKVEQLERVAKEYLCPFRDYLTNCKAIVDNLYLEDVPEDYQVFDRDNVRYIVIDELDEYLKTEQIRNKYNLKCVAKR